MKPGNLFIQGAKSGGRRKMRIRFTRIESSVCGFFIEKNRIERNLCYGKEIIYLRMRYQRPPR